MLSQTEPPAETRSPVDGAPHVRAQIVDGAVFDAPYAVMNVLATIVATYGLLENSAAVVIGAMLIAQLLGPIAGIALALVTGDAVLLRRAVAAECGGALLVLGVSFVLGKIHHDLPLGTQALSRTEPNLLDLLIALAGGSAGAYAMLSPKLRPGLAGVAISTALVPPLSVCGLCLARSETSLAYGGFLLFLANLVAIQLAFSLVLSVHGLRGGGHAKGLSGRRIVARHIVSVVLLAALAVVLGGSFTRSVARQREEADVRAALTSGLRGYPGAELADLRFDDHGSVLRVTAVVRSSGAVSPAKVAALQSRLPRPSGKQIELIVRSVITKTATAHGYLEDSKDSGLGDTPSSQDTEPDTDGGNNAQAPAGQ